MIETNIWYSGQDNYLKNTLITNDETKQHTYEIEILEEGIPIQENRNIYEVYNDLLTVRQTKTVQVLFSGGLDSELTLHACLKNKIPVEAVTLRLKGHGITLNTHDLYHSGEYCRRHGVKQIIIDLDAISFFENGLHRPYLDKYKIFTAHIATHFWLFEQCTGFPVIGGEYTWPWSGTGPTAIISPTRHLFTQYDRFLAENNIHGIGSMQNRSFELNALITKAHIDYMRSHPENKLDELGVIQLKQGIHHLLGNTNTEPRPRAFGWEQVRGIWDIKKEMDKLEKEYGNTVSSTKWGPRFAKILGGDPGTNDRFK
jgi:hypothetical protein